MNASRRAAFSAAPLLDLIIVTKRPQNIPKLTIEYSPDGRWPQNAILLVSAENQVEWDRRVPILRQMKREMSIRRIGVSAEPLLEPIVMRPDDWHLDWIIAGGESGKHARDTPIDAFYGLRAAAITANVPFFMKQMPHKAPIPQDLMTREFPR